MDSVHYLNNLTKCVRCGSCKAYCPTYDEAATETMGARGRLALLHGLATGVLTPSTDLSDRIFSCTLCGACSGACPTGVNIKEVIYHGRALLKGEDKKRRVIRRLINFSLKRPTMAFHFLRMAQYILSPYAIKKGLIPAYTHLPDRPLRDAVKVVSVPQKKGRIALFTGCMVNYMYPYLGESLINVLNALGYEVILPATESCCAAPLRGLGLEEEAKECARKNVRLYNQLNVEAVLSLCPTCTMTIRSEYLSLIGDGIQKAQDISTFLIDKLKPFAYTSGSSSVQKAIYHDPCHLKFGLSIEREPRAILTNLGFDLVKTGESRCCGFAGTFSLSFRDLSQRILDTCLNEYAKAEAEMIVTSCPGCILYLSKGYKNKPVAHLIEVVEKAVVKSPIFSLSESVL